MDDHRLLSDLEAHIEQSFGIRVEHFYDRRLIRRFFSKLSFRAAEDGGLSPVPAAMEQWPPLDLFRNAHVQREAFGALRTRSHGDVLLANLLIPVAIRSGHAGVTQKMFDSVIRSFFLNRYVRKSFTLPEAHEEFATWLLLSLVSDRVMVVETDFSHERNMALKYTVRPLEEKVLRTPPIVRGASLFFSRAVASTVKTGIYIGVHGSISDIFNREIGYSDFDGIDDRSRFGPNPSAGFLVIAGQRRDYSCAYIAPLYSLINRQSAVMERILGVFETFMDLLGGEAFYRIDRNKHHSRLRHTIGVEVHHLTTNYAEIFALRSQILEAFKGNANTLNIQLAKVNALINDLSRDVVKQFGAEFDIFGNRRSKRGEQVDRVRLSPEELQVVIGRVTRGAAAKRHVAHFFIEFAHKASVEVTSASTLVICLTELFNNAVKYNVAEERIRVRTRDRGDVVMMTISNVGPSLSSQEAELMPLMGLRGMNSQRFVNDGSGQGLATVFSILEDIGIDADYKQRDLTKEQISRLVSHFGSKKVSELDLSTHTIELALPTGRGGGNE